MIDFPGAVEFAPAIGEDFPGSGRYRVEEHLAVGGSSLLLRVHDTDVDAAAVIKLLLRRFAELPEHRERFLQEEKILRALRHPNIVRVFDSGTLDTQPWFAMDHLAGGSAAQRLRDHGPWPVRDALMVILDVLDALDYSHRIGIIHRDVKPANVLLDAHGTGFLVDFGIARHPVHRRTVYGDLMGTPAYMSPEQFIDPGMVDERADLYGVGAVLYALLTGENATPLAMAPPARNRALAATPQPYRDVIRWATETLPDDRPDDAEQLADAIEDLLAHALDHPPPP